jgi:hypothetical protein
MSGHEMKARLLVISGATVVLLIAAYELGEPLLVIAALSVLAVGLWRAGQSSPRP